MSSSLSLSIRSIRDSVVSTSSSIGREFKQDLLFYKNQVLYDRPIRLTCIAFVAARALCFCAEFYKPLTPLAKLCEFAFFATMIVTSGAARVDPNIPFVKTVTCSFMAVMTPVSLVNLAGIVVSVARFAITPSFFVIDTGMTLLFFYFSHRVKLAYA